MIRKSAEQIKKEEGKEGNFNLEDINKDKILLNRLENEEINFESINFNINPFKIENLEYRHNNIVKYDDSTFKKRSLILKI